MLDKKKKKYSLVNNIQGLSDICIKLMGQSNNDEAEDIILRLAVLADAGKVSINELMKIRLLAEESNNQVILGLLGKVLSTEILKDLY